MRSQTLGDGDYASNWAPYKNCAGSRKAMRLDLGDGISQAPLFLFTE